MQAAILAAVAAAVVEMGAGRGLKEWALVGVYLYSGDSGRVVTGACARVCGGTPPVRRRARPTSGAERHRVDFRRGMR